MVDNLLPCITTAFIELVTVHDPEAVYIVDALDYIASTEYEEKIKQSGKKEIAAYVSNKLPLVQSLKNKLTPMPMEST